MKKILEYSKYNSNFLDKYDKFLEYKIEEEELEEYTDSELKIAKSYFPKCSVRAFFIGQQNHLLNLSTTGSINVAVFKLVDDYYLAIIQGHSGDDHIWIKLDQRDQFKEFIQSVKEIISKEGRYALMDYTKDAIKKLKSEL